MEHGVRPGDGQPLGARAGSPGGREIPLPCRISELLRLGEAQVPRALVPAAAWDRLRAIPDPLPPLASEAAFECRLDDGDDQVDLEICLRAESDVRRRLAEAFEEPPLRRAEALSPCWRRVFGFLRAWVDPASPLHEAIATVWLEFDAPPAGAAPEPFVVFTLDPERFYSGGAADRPALRATLRTGLDLLAGGRLDSRTAAGVLACLSGFSPSTQVLHAAVRPTPEGDLARLVLRMPWRELPDTLARLEWPGSLPELRAHLERLCSSTLVHSVNLDVGARLGPRVGIEFHHPTSPRDDPRWRSLFDGLEAVQACTAEKRRLLAEWPSSADGRREPGSLRIQRELLVKVVHEPGVPLRAKAYLPFGPRLVLD